MGRHNNVAWFLTLFLLLVSESAMAEPPCEMAFVSIPYCLEFLTGLYYKPSTKCCNHINKLNKIAKRGEGNVRLLCSCIEGMVRGMQPPLQFSRIQQLPNQCDTHLSFPISENMDCSMV
ncbi:non-specific lipid-transfer protein 13-like [Mangifera indica]|uniref:non-specific lipid-transfer protein 13-like n=1 Tax=Mangifera indica TaxID=29780 RepID=UPI001CF94AD7|nr:non-specific lipid-transfer protein 13-like [Mangifera indica]